MLFRFKAGFLLGFLAAMLFFVLVPAAFAGTRKVDGSISDWKGESTWIGGMINYSHGEFIYQDRIYDDTGAGALDEKGVPVSFKALARGYGPPWGGYRYPTDFTRYGGNCADIMQLRITSDDKRLYVLIWLNTLLASDTTVAAIAFGDTVSSAVYWPFQAGIATPGTKHVLTLWGTGGAWDQADLKDVRGEVAVSVENNVIEASIPLTLLQDTFIKGTRQFRVYAATGLWDPEAHSWKEIKNVRDGVYPGYDRIPSLKIDYSMYWRTDLPRIFNVAFRAVEGGPSWSEEKQAEALRNGDISCFFADVDLNAHGTKHPPPPTGLYERIFKSSVTVPSGADGINEGFSEIGVRGPGGYAGQTPSFTTYHFLGQYQTYMVYVPQRYDRMQVYLHGGGLSHYNHLKNIGVQRDLGETGRALLVSPLGRGTVGWYTDYSHLDVIEAMEDAYRNYARVGPGRKIDPDRISISGYSMGGYGANRLQVLHPDLFNASVNFSGEPGNEDHYRGDPGHPGHGNGNPVDLLENVRHIPMLIVHGDKDAAAPVQLQEAVEGRLKALGYQYRFYRHPDHGHMNLYYNDEWSREAQWLSEAPPRQKDPVRVTFKTSEKWWRPDISPRLVFDKAYWVSGLRVRDKTLDTQYEGMKSFGIIDVTTHALGGGNPGLQTVSGSAYAPVNGYYTYTGQDYVFPGQAIPRENSFEVTLANLKSVTLDTGRMGIEIPGVGFFTHSDGPCDLTLTGDWPKKVDVFMDGILYDGFTGSKSGLSISIPEGSHTFRIMRDKHKR